MNSVFSEHVTSTAFFLSMSKKQIRLLQNIEAHPHPAPGYWSIDYERGGALATRRSLEANGLLVRVMDNEQQGHDELTEAGKLVCALLREAGFVLVALESAA